MDGIVFGADHPPTALGLDCAHGSKGLGAQVAHAGAMWNLIEAVLRGDRADLYRLEKQIVAGIAIHAPGPFNDQS